MSDDDSADGGRADPAGAAVGPEQRVSPERRGLSAAGAPSVALAAQCEAAYRHFIGKLEAAEASVDLRQTLAESEHELHRRLGTLTGPEQELERFEAAIEHLRLVRRLGPEARRGAKAAFALSRYVDELRAIWTRPDIHDIDPRLLSTLGESIAWAGYYAGLHVPASPSRA